MIGSGYTGLNAALQTARGGRHTVVFDAEDAGFGCSTRNGGQISTSIKPAYATLARRHGEARAFGILREGQQSLAWLGEFVPLEKEWTATSRWSGGFMPPTMRLSTRR